MRWLPLLLCLWLCTGLSLAAEKAQKDHALRLMTNFTAEELHYSIDFLFFKRLAAGRLSFRSTAEPDIYIAELEGRTLGVAAWLTSERTQRYTSRMRLMPDGRLRSLVHESQILKRKNNQWSDRGKRYRFDHAQGKVYQEKSRDGIYRPDQQFNLPKESDPVDILTAFYNLRAGIYGPLTAGSDLAIPTFSSKGFNEIGVHVMTPEEQRAEKFFPPSGLLLRVHIDPEVFETDSGDLFVWLNNDGEPERGIVEDIIGMGDVRGYRKEQRDE